MAGTAAMRLWMTTADVASALGVGTKYVWALVETGAIVPLPGPRGRGKQFRFDPKEVEEYASGGPAGGPARAAAYRAKRDKAARAAK
jgi:excisionase family DNA binding protein